MVLLDQVVQVLRGPDPRVCRQQTIGLHLTHRVVQGRIAIERDGLRRLALMSDAVPKKALAAAAASRAALSMKSTVWQADPPPGTGRPTSPARFAPEPSCLASSARIDMLAIVNDPALAVDRPKLAEPGPMPTVTCSTVANHPPGPDTPTTARHCFPPAPPSPPAQPRWTTGPAPRPRAGNLGPAPD